MAEEDKVAQRRKLIYQLGLLLAPITKLVEKNTPPTSADYRVTAAAFRPDYQSWVGEVSQFVVVGGVRFDYEYDDISRGPNNILRELGRLAKATDIDDQEKQAQLKECLEQCLEQTLRTIDEVPIEWEPKLFQAKTPFSTYLKIGDAISTAKQRIHYFDRYLNVDFYHLYLREVNQSLEIRLITTPGKNNYGVTNVRTVSQLASQQFTNYQLIECLPADMHDRNLRIDDKICHLGPSVSAAGKCPTNFTFAESTPQAHQILDNLIHSGAVIT